MKTKIYTLIFLFFIFNISFVFGSTNYTEVGTQKGEYMLGSGLFNSDLLNTAISTRTISSQKQIPFVADLDNDGINEIIIIDGLTIRLFRGSGLIVVDSFNLPSDERYSNMIIFDVDNDNKSEMIIALEESESLQIIEYNGTNIFTDNIFSLSGLKSHTNGEMLIKCGKSNECLISYITSVSGLVRNNVSIVVFNSTDLGSDSVIHTTSTNTNQVCFSKIRNMVYKDYDIDGNNEYIFTFYDEAGSSDDVLIKYVSVVGLVGTVEQTVNQNLGFGVNSGSCLSIGTSGILPQNAFTSPLVFDVDGSPSNGLETIIGHMKDNSNFKMRNYNSNGVLIDIYPLVFNSDGIIISNVFRTNAFTDTGVDDFCIMGYQKNLQLIDLTCASDLTTQLLETNEYFLSIKNLYNITTAYNKMNVITHSAQHSTAIQGGRDLNEIVTPYGILELDVSSCSILGNCDMNLIFENPQRGGDNNGSIVISVDVEKSNADDLLVLTSTNLWYIDDLFSNSNAVVVRVTTNPSIQNTIKVNETVQTTIECSDSEGDSVQSRMIAYYGLSNQQDSNWSVLSASGTTFPFNFKSNKTVVNAPIIFLCRDSQHNESVNLSFSLSVSNNGAVFGDSIFDTGDVTVDVIVDSSIGEGGTNNTRTNNIVRDAIIEISESSLFTPTMFMLLFIFVSNIVLLSLFFYMGGGSDSDGLIKLILSLLFMFDFFVIISFAYLRLLSTAFTVTSFFILIVFGYIYINTKLQLNSGE